LAGRGQFRRKAVAFAEGSGAVFNRERAIENRRPGQPMQLFTQQRAIAGVGFNGDDPGAGDHRCERERHGAMMRAAVEESLAVVQGRRNLRDKVALGRDWGVLKRPFFAQPAPGYELQVGARETSSSQPAYTLSISR